MVLLIFIAFIVLCITADAIVQYSRSRKSKAPAFASVSTRVFNEAAVTAPKGLFFQQNSYLGIHGKERYGKNRSGRFSASCHRTFEPC